MSLEDTRREYQYDFLTRESLKKCPIDQFSNWMNDALKANLSDPSAMSLATVNADGQSWQRTVLLKNFDKNGFIFYTNLGSRKALDIKNNSNVSLLFPWFDFYNLDKKYADSDIPGPDFWGGYRIAPREIEFWQGGKNRLHDRFKYVLTSKEWKVSRLSP